MVSTWFCWSKLACGNRSQSARLPSLGRMPLSSDFLHVEIVLAKHLRQDQLELIGCQKPARAGVSAMSNIKLPLRDGHKLLFAGGILRIRIGLSSNCQFLLDPGD